MSNTLTENIRDIDIGSLLNVLFDSHYYEILFPFLLVFALLYTVLEKIKIFQNKTTKKPYKSVIVVIATIISFFSVSFELSPGHSVGQLMMMLFPSISALTIGILGLYIVGSIFAKDFFSGLFDKRNSSFIFIAVGAIGLGSIIFYVGVAMGFWDHLALTNQNNWNVTLAVGFLILGIVFLFVDLVPFGLILLFIVGSFVWNDGQLDGSGSILEMFVDPVIFILTIIALMIQWMGGDNLSKEEAEFKKDVEEFEKTYKHKFNSGSTKEPYKDRIYDISESGLMNRKNRLDKLKAKQNR